MTGSSLDRPTSNFRGVNVVVRADNSEVHLDDLATADEGQAVLDEVDAAILHIEDRLDRYKGDDPDWRRRAGVALKKKRRVRPALQKRIADLRKAEREAERIATVAAQQPGNGKRRYAFVQAAEAMLDRDLYVEIWQRAAETDPQAFEGWEGVPA